MTNAITLFGFTAKNTVLNFQTITIFILKKGYSSKPHLDFTIFYGLCLMDFIVHRATLQDNACTGLFFILIFFVNFQSSY